MRLKDLFPRRPAPPEDGANAAAPLNLNAPVNARVDDSTGWSGLGWRPHELDPARRQEMYSDALTAWRKNPIALRIIQIITDYVVGDRIIVSSPAPSLDRFIQAFWSHPKNRMDLRLEAMSDELARAGDLFVALFRNPQDGMSYIRFVTKDRILRIETAENDWETELVYCEMGEGGGERRWLSPHHPQAAASEAVMLHYAVNRVLGALMGESDLAAVTPWLQRYSRMLEDRVRLHWALRSFLWFVTVPTNRVAEKLEQYRTPPESGSIIVKDDSERWEVNSPSLHGADSGHDLKAVRGMIDAGSGHPPHWRGDATTTNLATARAMQAPTERHLQRRQQYFLFMLKDILYTAYQRAVEIGRARPLGGGGRGWDHSPAEREALIHINLPDISREDNESLARSAMQAAQGLKILAEQLGGRSPALDRLFLQTVFKFAGEPQPDDVLDRILAEAYAPPPAAPSGATGRGAQQESAGQGEAMKGGPDDGSE